MNGLVLVGLDQKPGIICSKLKNSFDLTFFLILSLWTTMEYNLHGEMKMCLRGQEGKKWPEPMKHNLTTNFIGQNDTKSAGLLAERFKNPVFFFPNGPIYSFVSCAVLMGQWHPQNKVSWVLEGKHKSQEDLIFNRLFHEVALCGFKTNFRNLHCNQSSQSGSPQQLI